MKTLPLINKKLTFTLRTMMGWIYLLTLLTACGPVTAPVVATTPTFTGSATSPTSPPTFIAASSPTIAATSSPTLTATVSPTITASPNAFPVKKLARWGEGPANGIAWSPDGRIIAIAHSAGIALQDASTLSEISFWETALTARELAFSPDGERLAVGEGDGRVEIYSLPEGILQQTFPGDSSGVISLAFSPDGQRLLSTNENEQARLWDLQIGKIIHSVNCSICNAGFSSSGQPLAWKRAGDVFTIWDVEQGMALRSLSTTWSMASAFNSDWSQLATGGDDGILRIWQPDGNGYKLLNSLESSGKIWSVAFSPDKKILAAGNDQAKIYVWDVQTWQLRTVLSEAGDVTFLLFSPDSQSLLSSSYSSTTDESLKFWDIRNGNLKRSMARPATYAKGMFLSNGQLWGELDGNTETVLLDLTSGKNLQRFQRNMQGPAFSWRLAISSDGRLVAANDGYNLIKVVDPGTGKTLHTFGDFPGPLTNLNFSPDGRRLVGLFATDAASVDPKGILRVWDLSNWAELYSQTISLAWGFAFSSDSSRIALGGHNGKIFIYRTESGKLLQTLAGHEDAVTSLAFSPDGAILASGGQDGTIRLWDLQTRKEVRLLDRLSQDVRNSSVPVRIGCMDISPDGSLLVTGEEDGMIRFWNMATGLQIAAFQGHRGEVETLDFNLDGTQFISGGQDGTLRLWKINP
jgi:WD40 repeat protein